MNIEDWNDSTLKIALNNIRTFKNTAEKASINSSKESENKTNKSVSENTFEINFVASDGKQKTKRFDKSEKTSKGKMLSRSIKSNLDAMGMAVSDNEKRQVLMELLLELCGEK